MKLRLDFQHCRNPFPRTSIYLARWTPSFVRFGNFTWQWTSFGERKYAVLLKHWKGVVLTRAMSSAGRSFMKALKKLLTHGRYYLLYFRHALSAYQNTFFRMGLRVAAPKTCTGAIHPLLQFVHPSSFFGTPKFWLNLFRERTSERSPRPYRSQWVR